MFIALVTFENDGDALKLLPEGYQGACGWMAVRAISEEQASDQLRRVLREIDLKVLEIDDLLQVYSLEEIACYDEHLAANVEEWESEQTAVWGTLHVYLADGEA